MQKKILVRIVPAIKGMTSLLLFHCRFLQVQLNLADIKRFSFTKKKKKNIGVASNINRKLAYLCF